MFDLQTALTKSYCLKSIQKFPEKSRAKKNIDVPGVLARFEDMLLQHAEDYKTEALSDDLKKEAFKELIPPALEQTIKDVVMSRDMRRNSLSSAQVKSIIKRRRHASSHPDECRRR